MTHPNPSTALARVVMDEIAAHGAQVVVISPGSRSGALAIAAAEHDELETRVLIDERSAAFHALGVARATGRPSVVISTSGTAAANFLPAIVEADMSCLPLVAITADRPVELQGVGANQTIHQVGLYGSKPRGDASIEAPDADTDRNVEWRGTVSSLLAVATGAKPGPVHLNVRFREPTVPVTDDGRTRGEVYPFETPRVGTVVRDVPEAAPGHPALLATRGLIIVGDGEYDRESVAGRAADLGWPILATALSGMRGGGVVDSYHHLLSNGVPPELRPATVVAVGGIGPSARLETLVASAETRVRIDRWGRHIDPGRNATHVLTGDVVSLLEQVAGERTPEFRDGWLERGRSERSRLDQILARVGPSSGAAVAKALNEIPWDALVVASSLPIREVDAHVTRRGPVYANRGASGIDGFVSTALGVASSVPRTLAVTGDLSLLHDSNGFLSDTNIDVVFVVIDNDGGGLFDSLPQSVHAPEYERLFVTSHHRDLETLASLQGIRYQDVVDTRNLPSTAAEALERRGIDLIRVAVDRGHDLMVRAQLDR